MSSDQEVSQHSTSQCISAQYENQLRDYIRQNSQFMDDLRSVRSLGLPQCYIAAGYIRNMVWDRLHHFPTRNLHDDIDVVYYDHKDVHESKDREYENSLRIKTNNPRWSVKNQARMHSRNGAQPYSSTADALKYWPETATAVGVNINDNDEIQICSPHGLDDLFNLNLRMSPYCLSKNLFNQRVDEKGWHYKWPDLILIRP